MSATPDVGAFKSAIRQLGNELVRLADDSAYTQESFDADLARANENGALVPITATRVCVDPRPIDPERMVLAFFSERPA